MLSGNHLLLVEDNEINLQVARELLEHVEVSVTIAMNGEQAVELVKKNGFNGVLMDVYMPVMDGLTATRKIRSFISSDKLPILAMTAGAMAGDREQCLEAGMNDHIPKPIKPMKFYETLIRWLRPDVAISLSRKSGRHFSGDSSDVNPAMSFLESVDARTGLSHVNHDEKLYYKILENVYHRFKNIDAQIQAVLKQGDYHVAERLIHTFKGVAGTMGAKNLHEVSRKLEVAIKKKEGKSIQEQTAALSQELSRVMTELEKLFSETDFAESVPVPEANEIQKAGKRRMEEVFSELSDLIDEGDSDAVVKVGMIKEFDIPDALAEQIEKLESEINNYEFDDARETFHRISNELGLNV